MRKYDLINNISSKNVVPSIKSMQVLDEQSKPILNWKKIKKFVHPEKTGNETNGRDRAYTHQEIQKIWGFIIIKKESID